MKKISRNLLGEVQFLIIIISMLIMIAVVSISMGLISYSMLKDLRARALATADELVSLLEQPLYNVDDEASVRIARAFLSSGKISGIELQSIAGGSLISDLKGQDSVRIPKISRTIEAQGMSLGSFTITFSDEEIGKSQAICLLISLMIIISVLLANIAASRYIARRVRKPFLTIFSAIEKLSEGSYQTQIAPTQYRDINTLVSLFNEMAGKIHEKNQEQMKVEQDLLAERQCLIDIIDFLPDATFIVDNEKRVVVWNRAAEAMTGTSRNDIIGKGDFAYAEPFIGKRQPILIDLLDVTNEEIEKFYKYIRRSESVIYAESYIPHLHEGHGAHLWGVAAPIFNRSGVRTGAIEMIRDVTELKLIEQEKIALKEQLLQTQKMESVGRLAGGIAHDFNNMLTIILGHSQLALIGKFSPDLIIPHLKIIEETTYRSASLVRQLLAFARKQAVAPRSLDINATIANMQTMLQRLIGEDIVIAWKPGENPWTVWIDPSQIDQILINLCVNARDAISGVGKISLETANIIADMDYCRLNTESVPGEYVMLAVSDDGCGMDKETIDHIFEPFFTTKEVGKGTGMGLATVYGIVKQNKGFINVYSEPGQGTTFKVYLPRFTGEREEFPEVGETANRNGKGETILVVEDDAFILGLSRQMLEQLGYKVYLADSPNRAIAHMRDHGSEIQLLITDVVMPGMNGRDLDQTLRIDKPDLKCLFISGYTANVIAHHGVLDKDVCFLQKPFSLEDLANKVQQALAQPKETQHQ